MMPFSGGALRWMYRSGRPNRVAALMNRWSARLGAAGVWSTRLAALEVRGRRSGRVVLRHGGAEQVRLEEVDPVARPPILRRYLQVAPGGRPHIPVDRRAPLAEFAEVADRYPVFRIRPAVAATS
jgi:hypothetical protein